MANKRKQKTTGVKCSMCPRHIIRVSYTLPSGKVVCPYCYNSKVRDRNTTAPKTIKPAARRQFHLKVDQDCEILINGKPLMRIDQVADDKAANLYIYPSVGFEEAPFGTSSGCIGSLIVDLN